MKENIFQWAYLYAECKCYETELESHKLQAFFGKYMTQWFQNNQSHGLFIALPGLNTHAKGFYRENCETTHGGMATIRAENVLAYRQRSQKTRATA